MGRLGHYNPPSHNAQRRLAGAISPVEYTQGHYPPPSTRKPAASMCQVPSKHRSMGTKVRFVEAPVAISQVHRWVRVLRKEPSPEKAERPFHSHARKSDAWLPSQDEALHHWQTTTMNQSQPAASACATRGMASAVVVV